MTKSKKIIMGITTVIAFILLASILWFNFYHHFSPLYEPCTKQLQEGMTYNEAKVIMNPYFNDSSISNDDSVYLSGTKRVLQFSDEMGVFCYIEFKDDIVTKISLGREF